jgi:hypothetical protein
MWYYIYRQDSFLREVARLEFESVGPGVADYAVVWHNKYLKAGITTLVNMPYEKS